MDLACFYGWLAFGAFGIALVSQHVPTIKYGLLMLASWVASNLCVAWLGYERAPILIAPIDGVLALILAGVARRTDSKVGVAIFLLFGEEMIIHCVGFLTDATEQTGYWAALNVIFLAQVVINGASGVSHGLAYWSNRVDHVPHSSVSRR